jgi:Tfp pilus assembly protein PilX
MRRTNPVIRQAERGFMLISVIVVLALSMTLFGLWAQAAIRQHRWLEGEALRMQATRLAESGVARAIKRRANDRGYTEETWSIPAAEFQSRNAAGVRIRIAAIGDELHVAATADYPADAVRRARITKQIDILNPIPGDES